MPGLDVGDHVADVTFLRPDGPAVRLSDFPGPLLLIFLRHLHRSNDPADRPAAADLVIHLQHVSLPPAGET